MARITVLVSLLLLSTAACTSEVITEETTEAAVSGLSKKDALAAFEKVIARYPDSELAESAQWMLSSESSELPAFESEAEDADVVSP